MGFSVCITGYPPNKKQVQGARYKVQGETTSTYALRRLITFKNYIAPILHFSSAPSLQSFYNLSKLRAVGFASPSLSVRPMPADETALSIRTETNEMVIAFEVEEVG